jgi:ethanolamine transporter EutH
LPAQAFGLLAGVLAEGIHLFVGELALRVRGAQVGAVEVDLDEAIVVRHVAHLHLLAAAVLQFGGDVGKAVRVM